MSGFPTDTCEWNPETDTPALVDGTGCPSLATVIVGIGNDWHLCDSCADLPQFRAQRHRLIYDD